MFDFLLTKPKAPQPGDIVRLRSGGLAGPLEYVGDEDGEGCCFRVVDSDGDMLAWDDEGYAVSGNRAHDIMHTAGGNRNFVGTDDILIYGVERWKVTHINWNLKTVMTHRISPKPGMRRYVGCFGSYFDDGQLWSPDAVIPDNIMTDLVPAQEAPAAEHIALSVEMGEGGRIDRVIEEIAAKHAAKEVPLIAAGLPATDDKQYKLYIELKTCEVTYDSLPGPKASELHAELQRALITKGCAVLNDGEGGLRVIRTDEILHFHLELET